MKLLNCLYLQEQEDLHTVIVQEAAFWCMISSVLDQKNQLLSAMWHILPKQTDVETEVLLQFIVKV